MTPEQEKKVDEALAGIQEIRNWIKRKEKQQIDRPLDSASIQVLKKALRL